MVISNFLISYTTVRLLGMWEESHKDELSFMGWDKLLTCSPQITQTWLSEINLSGGELNYLAFPTSLHLINWLCFRLFPHMGSLNGLFRYHSFGNKHQNTSCQKTTAPSSMISFTCLLYLSLLFTEENVKTIMEYSIIYICPNGPFGKRNTFMSVSPYSQLIHSTIRIYAKVIWW